MKFSQLAGYFEEIEKSSSRLIITNLLSELFKKLNGQEIKETVYLLQGRVSPLYEKIEFGIGERMIIKSILYALNIERSYFKKEYNRIGDLGKTTEFFKKQYSSFDEKDLSIFEVYDLLYNLAVTEGIGSQDTKTNILASLIRQLDPCSSRYIVRIPQAVMRMGFSDMTILDAYSWMISGDKSLRKRIEKAYHVRPDLGFIGQTLKEEGIAAIDKIEPKLFTPIIMMKAERLSSGHEIVKQIGEAAIEPKYDGFRIQVHYKKDSKLKVRLYSRNLEDVTHMYPDIVSGVEKQIPVNEIIFEGEAIGFDPETGSFLAFQQTVQRKRKYDVEKMAKEIPLKLFAFELLYADGINYINLPFFSRRNKLKSFIKLSKEIKKDTILLSPQEISKDVNQIENLFDKAVAEGLEGVIAKKLNGVYQPGARAWNWIKYKKSYSSKIEDTIDCIVMGYDFGKGKRTDFGIGAFLVGVYDEENDKFVTVAKIGTGLTDIEWKEINTKCQESKTKTQPTRYEVNKSMSCDIWINPKIVVEIKADEITKSPVHTACLALRFPRLEHFRTDKKPEDITTLQEFKKMFEKQGR